MYDLVSPGSSVFVRNEQLKEIESDSEPEDKIVA